MRSIFILSLFIPFSAFAFDGYVRSDGRLHPVSIDSSNSSQMRFWNKYANHGDAWVNSRTGQGRLGLPNGVMSPSTVPVTIQHKADKKAVMNSVFGKVKTYAKNPALRLGGGWVTIGASLALPFLLDEFFLDEEKGEFVAVSDHYFILFENNINLISGSWGPYNSVEKWQQFCQERGYTCKQVSVHNTSQDILKNQCLSQSPIDVGGIEYKPNGSTSGGRCLFSSPTSSTNRISGPTYQTTRINVHRTLTYEDFERLTLPVAESNPSEWVNASRAYQDGPIAGGASVASFTAPAGTTVTTNPYTDPLDGKAKQTTIIVNNDNRTARTSHMLRPDLDGQTDVAPVPDPLPENQAPIEENPTPQASAPVQCDKYPDSLGCEKMGDGSEAETIFNDITIPEIENPTQFTLDSFMPDSGSCPAPTSYNTSHGSIIYSYEKHCDTALMLRPFIIAFASLTALYLIFFRKA